jgi:hypothetical protein
VTEVQRHSELQGDALTRRLAELSTAFEEKVRHGPRRSVRELSACAQQASFENLVRTAGLDPVMVAAMTRELDGVLTEKGQRISSLRYEIAKVNKVCLTPAGARACAVMVCADGPDGARPAGGRGGVWVDGGALQECAQPGRARGVGRATGRGPLAQAAVRAAMMSEPVYT